MKARTVTILLVFLIQPLASVSAAVTNIDVELTDPGSVLPNFTSNDLRIDFTGGLKGQQLVVQLTAGSIFNDSLLGSNVPPPLPLLSAFPSVQYDSFVALGGFTSQTSFPIITVPGSLVPNCELSPGCVFNLAWAPGTGVEIPSGNDFVVARITLSHSAQGVVHYYGESAAGFGEPYITTGAIQNGVISFVPEPASVWLVGLAASTTCWNYRKRFTKREIV
jgi:hypothetical protein